MNMARLYINSTVSNTPFSEDFAKKMLELEFKLKGAEAHLRWDSEKECGRLFEWVVDRVKQLQNCKNC
jgi:hypothetical protein